MLLFISLQSYDRKFILIFILEFIFQLTRICVFEQKKVLLYITDQIFDTDLLQLILSDLIILMNGGGLPISIFTQHLLNELSAQSSQVSLSKKDEICFTEWRKHEIISNSIKANLHVVFAANITVLKLFEVI